jgi:3-methylcrotonyl-CoA carboxylase alpha subunit
MMCARPCRASSSRCVSAVGHAVSKGDALAVLEAMKMEHTLTAPRDGVVAAVNAGEGDQVQDGDLLVSLESEKE